MFNLTGAEMSLIMLFLAVIIASMLILKESYLKTTQIGLSEDMDDELRHGIAWVQKPGTGIYKVSFHVDKPAYLEDPSPFTIQNLFDQIEKMGLHGEFLEVMIGDVRRTFRNGVKRPIMVEPV